MKHLKRKLVARLLGLLGLLGLSGVTAQVRAEGVPSGTPGTLASSVPAAPAASAVPADQSALSPVRPVRLGELPALLGLPVELSLEPSSRPMGTPAERDRAIAPRAGALTLHEAIAKGVANSLEVQASDARRESFEYTATAARGALLPRLDARAASGMGRLESVDPYEQRRRKDGSVTFKQPLFDVPAVREYRRQGVLAASSVVQLQGAESVTSLDVASAYLQVTQATLNIELSRGYEKLLLELQDYISKRAEAGGASNAERDRVRARVANARSSIADSKATQRSLLRNLESLIGEPPSALLVQAPSWLRIPTQAEDARDEAERSNHDLLAARAEVDASAMERAAASARVLPRMELEVSHMRTLNGGGTASYIKDTKVMLVLNWSMLNGGSDLAQERAAHARTREKQLRADETRRKLWQELDGAYTNLDSVAERYGSLREELLANGAVVEAFRAQLVGGNRSLLDVLDALQRLHQSRLDIVQLALGEMQNQVKVAHLTGRLANASRARP